MARFEHRELKTGAPLYTRRAAVRFQDIDAAEIVFFPRFLEYFHDAWLDLLGEVGLDVPEVLREKRWAMPLRHAEADYLGSLRFGELFEVAVVAVVLEESAVSVGFRLSTVAELSRVVAVGQTEHVWVERVGERMERRPLSAELREAFERLQRGELLR